MKRIKALGLCLIAACAFSVAVAASAQAAKSISGPVVVTSVGIGEAELGNSVANIRCKSHTAHSVIITGTVTHEVVALYKGCEVAGKGIACKNKGADEIETKKLISDIDWVKSPTSVGVDFRPEAGALLAEFSCTAFAEVKVYGAIIGLDATALNHMTTEGELTFQEAGFKNVPANFEGEPNEHLEAEFVLAAGGTKKVESGQIQKDHTTNAPACTGGKKPKCGPNPAEVNTLANKAQPEYGRCKKKGGGKFSNGECNQLATKKGKFEFVPIPG